MLSVLIEALVRFTAAAGLAGTGDNVGDLLADDPIMGAEMLAYIVFPHCA